MPETDIPVGDRLGSERLYDEFDTPIPEPPPPPPPETHSMFSEAITRFQARKAANQPPTPPKELAPQAIKADRNWREPISTCLELAGLAAITSGCAMIAVWLGLIVLGVGLILLGVLITLPRKQ
jgi:hypothetical protein